LPEEASTGLAPHSAAKAAWLPAAQSVRVGAGSDQQLGRRQGTDAAAGQQLGGVLVDQAGDLVFQISGLGVEGEPAVTEAAQRAAGTVAGVELGAGAGEVGLAQLAELGAERVVGFDEQALDLVERLGAGLDGAAAGHQQRPQFTDDAAAVFGDGGDLAGQHRAGGILGVDGVAFAAPAPPGPVRTVDLPGLHALAHQEVRQAVTVAAGALDAGGGDGAKALGPPPQLLAAGVGGREPTNRQAATELIQ
jgi:hypothetical protein